jgi:peroxiredoxin Q/BCP
MVRTAVRLRGVATLAALLLAASPLAAQGASPAAAAPTGPAIGDPAPDFSLTAATRYGLLREPVRLSALRGQTVVLAFFYKARTKG